MNVERDWWDEVKAGYERLRANPQEWADYLAEAAVWDSTLSDGLGDPADEYPEYQHKQEGSA